MPSLVGSEMCIRDSSHSVQAHLRRREAVGCLGLLAIADVVLAACHPAADDRRLDRLVDFLDRSGADPHRLVGRRQYSAAGRFLVVGWGRCLAGPVGPADSDPGVHPVVAVPDPVVVGPDHLHRVPVDLAARDPSGHDSAVVPFRLQDHEDSGLVAVLVVSAVRVVADSGRDSFRPDRHAADSQVPRFQSHSFLSASRSLQRGHRKFCDCRERLRGKPTGRQPLAAETVATR